MSYPHMRRLADALVGHRADLDRLGYSPVEHGAIVVVTSPEAAPSSSAPAGFASPRLAGVVVEVMGAVT